MLKPLTVTVTPKHVANSYKTRQYCPIERAVAEKLHLSLKKVIAIPVCLLVNDHTYTVSAKARKLIDDFDSNTLELEEPVELTFYPDRY